MNARTSTTSGYLNAFQRVMQQWSELHPYNATHTYKIAGPVNLERFRKAVCETYAWHGLGLIHLASDGRSYRHEADDAPEIQRVQGGDDPNNCLSEHVTRELNRPFERPTCRPFRFALIDAGPGAHYVTTTYDHWVADSVSARFVLRDVLEGYCGLATEGNDARLNLYPGTYRDVFTDRLNGLGLAGAVARSVRYWNRNRSARQVAYSSASQMAVKHELYSTAAGTVTRLKEFAHGLGATVHDVILAAIGRAMAEVLPHRSGRGKSRELALGTIVDTRSDASADLSRVFGTFLAYYLVRCVSDRTATLAEMTRHVAQITRPIKERRGYLDSIVNLKFMNTVWPHLSESVKPHFTRSALPMTAGVSSVVLRESWIDRNRESILGYSRGSPTGPNAPLVLAPTTLGETMNVGLTYRITGFSQSKIDNIMGIFLDQIENPNESSRAKRSQAANHESIAVGKTSAAARRPALSGVTA